MDASARSFEPSPSEISSSHDSHPGKEEPARIGAGRCERPLRTCRERRSFRAEARARWLRPFCSKRAHATRWPGGGADATGDRACKEANLAGKRDGAGVARWWLRIRRTAVLERLALCRRAK